MNFSDERKYNRWFIIFAGLAVIVLVLWNTTIFFNRLKDEERTKMSIWAEAL
ncbi:MAG: two-component sensor histidine kinase, partial [Flavobacteriaceae bacterium]|nr:two-component sensor histidine kinase [Flavobacteriaceae bacterium]